MLNLPEIATEADPDRLVANDMPQRFQDIAGPPGQRPLGTFHAAIDFGVKAKGGDCGEEAVAGPAQVYGAHLAAQQVAYGRFHSQRHGEGAGQVVARAAGQQPQGRVRASEGCERLADGAVAAADHEPLSALGHGLLRQLGCVALGPRVAQLDRSTGVLQPKAARSATLRARALPAVGLAIKTQCLDIAWVVP